MKTQISHSFILNITDLFVKKEIELLINCNFQFNVDYIILIVSSN